MKVFLSSRARADMEAIGEFIAEDSPRRAVTFIDELQSACFGLAEHPYRFAPLEGSTRQRYRRRPLGNYAIIYVVDDDIITVMRVLSAAQNLDNALGLN